ncbi:xanthine dehydrogenase family protein molybdopterin-binding subunit [Hymenobacter crusticola]|uniref:Aldehyde oxidase/xanthine dehydrogenase a/b hammerhead domain-containing protein n=1 Tax=Hymenobacter crusticola TaxID=1770526 RepID=A0A243W6D3_9BACT|nr:xanthine dehydrogenase family protein molybdopterin-binding subunit [Hymenobacter crusticola]OUJ69840.1 hypothetical protein BXP70_25975 [Hymenobacter crusticola]
MKSIKAALIDATLNTVETLVGHLPDPAPDPLRNAREFIGKPYPRVDGRLKVTGQARYATEHPIAGMTHAVVVHSSIAKGKISHLDTQAAESVPGVLAVMTHRNAPRMKTPETASLFNPVAGSNTSVPVMQSADITWNGEAVAVVVAETLELANYAAGLVGIRYEEEPAALSLEAEKGNATIPTLVVTQSPEVNIGDAKAALAVAPVVSDQEYETPWQNQHAMEPHASIAAWMGKDQLLVYDSTQSPPGVQHNLARMFDLKPEQVRVVTEFVGGAFGGKVAAWSNVPLAAAAARLVGRPVKLALSRAGVSMVVGGRTLTQQRVALGATLDGKLTAMIHTGYGMRTTKDVWAEQYTFPIRHLYASPNIHVLQKVVRLDRVQNSYMRAPGETPGSFALESAMDELAHKLGLDPVELRMRNEPDKDPTHGTYFSSRHLREAYALAAGKFGWDPQRPEPGTQREGDWLIGTGVATAFYPVQQLPVTIKARITADGHVEVSTSSIEMGVGLATVQTQHIAERFGVPYERARYLHGDTDLPMSQASGGSAATSSVGAAIHAAADKLTEKLLKLAQRNKQSVLRGVKRKNVELRAGGLYRLDQPAVGESYEQLLGASGQAFVEAEGSVPASALVLNMKTSMASYGAHFCEVRVHARTRQVQVRRFMSAFDCGRIMNPQTARSQIVGGIIMGIGMALMEEAVYDERTGRLMTPSLGEYHVPVHADVPEFEVYFLDEPDPVMPMGTKPVGEVSIVGTAAAVANAVFQATGIRVRHLPITADKLL